MTTKYYLVIDGIAGDYFDPSKLLTGAFQVSSFVLTTKDSGSVAHGAAPATFEPLSLVLNSGSAAGLLAAEASGQVIKAVSLVGVSTDSGRPIVTSSLNLSDVVISNLQDSSTSVINLALDYRQVGLVTTGLNPGGSPQPSQSFGWDIPKNTSAGPGTSLKSAGSASVAPTVPVKYYLLIGGLNGDVTDKTHAGWFDLSSFNINLANTTNPLQVAGGGKDVFSPLSIVTTNQTAINALLQHEADGKALDGLRIEGVDANGNAVYDLNLASAQIASVSDLSIGLGVSFDYKEVSLVTRGENGSGTLVQTGSFGWDLATNQAIDPKSMPSISVGTNHGAVAPTSYYLVINGTPGDYSDKLLTGAFKVSSFALTDTAQGAGKTTFALLNLALNTDSVAGLLAAEANGTDIKSVSLVGETTVNGRPEITYSLNLGNVGVQTAAPLAQGIDVSLDYKQIGLVTQGLVNGALQTAQSFGWDLATNTATGPGTSVTSAGSSAVAPTVPTTFYLLIDGMNGGVADKAHAGWFKLENFNLELSKGFGGVTVFSALSLTLDSGQTGLAELLQQESDGKALTGARVEGIDAAGQAVYDLNLADAHITKVTDPSAGGVAIDLDYQKISLVTRGQTSDGKLVQTGSFGWDRAQKQDISPSTMPSISAGTDHGTVAPTSYFLVINGIAGDTDTAKLLTGAFKVNSFELPTTNQNGLPSFGQLQLTLNSQTVAGLLAAEASGEHIKDASLVGVSTISGRSSVSYSLNLKDVLVTGISAANAPTISVSLDYRDIGLVTTGVGPTGARETSQVFGWDRATNTVTGPGISLTSAQSATVAATVPTNYFLLIDGLNGGVLDKAHAGWFTLNAFGLGVSNTGSIAQITAGKDIFGNLQVSTGSDTGLTALLQDEAEGKHLTGVRIEGVDANGHAVYDLNIADVLVTGVTDQNTPGLNIGFDYNKISLVTHGTGPFGNLEQTGSFGWDIATSQSIDPATMPNIAPCYCRGTLIMTERGDVPVEELAIGNSVMTMSGAARPIKWIGRRAYSGRFALGNKDVLPVCIEAGAIEDNVPRRDLWISPHHAMYLQGVLIEAIDLVNEVTISQATEIETVEYFHIELETHDIIIAEGALSESFVDDDSRGMFHNAHEFAALYPEQTDAAPRYCAPRCKAGYELDSVRRWLALRAGLQMARGGSAIGAVRGYVDTIGAGRIAGWAQNVDRPEAPVCLDIHVDGRLVGRTLANRYRSDLKQAGFGSGCHGFQFEAPPDVELTADTLEVRRSLDGAALAFLQADREGRLWVVQPREAAFPGPMSRPRGQPMQLR